MVHLLCALRRCCWVCRTFEPFQVLCVSYISLVPLILLRQDLYFEDLPYPIPASKGGPSKADKVEVLITLSPCRIKLIIDYQKSVFYRR